MSIEANSLTGYTRVDGLWFSDGSLVVRAETALFRISGAILAARSSVFRDMLSFPQPGLSATEERLSRFCEQFSTRDIQCLHASALFAPVIGHTRRPAPLVQIRHLVPPPPSSGPSIDDISDRFPIYLEYWDTFQARFQSLKPSADADAHLHILSVIHEVNALWLLPAAYARASRSRPPRFFAAPSWCTLSDAIKNKLYLAHAHATQHVITVVHALGYGGRPTTACTVPDTCKLEISLIVASLLDMIRNPNSEFIFVDLKEIFLPSTWVNRSPPMCDACRSQRKDLAEHSMQRVWDGLPANLGLPPWDELKAMRDAAVEGDLW
ncbi:hypothetical protein B0H12DRAFT_527000 [Mycena haematopus]|nr:hypothetical protein B0H12DRAFT_527000 [Mycena haematopus]